VSGRAHRDFLRAFLAWLPSVFTSHGIVAPPDDSNVPTGDKGQANESLAALRRVTEINHEGTLLLMYGCTLLFAGHSEEAEATFLEVANAPAWCPSSTRRGRYAAAMAAFDLFQKKGDGAALGRSAKYARQYLDAGLLTPVQDAGDLLVFAIASRDVELCRDLVSAGLRHSPRNSTLLWRKSQLDLVSGDYLGAIKAADCALEPQSVPERPELDEEHRRRLLDSLLRPQITPMQAGSLKKEAVQKLMEYTQKMQAEPDGR
jgi:hypothetical protein